MNAIYEKTGTLAPLINKKEYTEEEKIVLLHFFTNIDKNIYCATDNLSSQLWAFLMGQYSRTQLSMRDRFLQLFEDSKKAYEQGKIPKEEHISIKDLAKSIQSGNLNTINYFNKVSAEFLKKWGVDYGHNSLKDADRIRFAIEGVSIVFTKVIESPFPALGDFQEKSTRYVHFGRESVISSPILDKSEYGTKIKQLNNKLMDLYLESFSNIKEILVANKVIKKEDFKREDAFERTLNAKAFDIVRYLLPSGTSTSLGASFSARICESHLSEMLSHPIEEVRLVAKSMHTEALKVSPGLLSRVGVNQYLKTRREQSNALANEIFYKKEFGEIIRGIEDNQRVKLIGGKNIDELVIASILFEHGRAKGVSFQDCLNRANHIPQSVKEKIIETEIGGRGQFDRMPRTLQHGSVIFEFICDFGGYRDIQRHRASSQLWQGATAIHGYDYPEYIDLMGMDDFKQKYDEVMTQLTQLAREVIQKYPYEAEYICALGHLIRTTFEMHPGQLAYVSELRTTPQGHHSYRRLFQHVHKIMQDTAPILSKYIKVNVDIEGSRIKQEEKAAEKREKLGL